MPKEYTQANINLTKDDANMVDFMMKSDGDVIRSAFVRKLIRKEWERRFGAANPEPELVSFTHTCLLS